MLSDKSIPHFDIFEYIGISCHVKNVYFLKSGTISNSILNFLFDENSLPVVSNFFRQKVSTGRPNFWEHAPIIPYFVHRCLLLPSDRFLCKSKIGYTCIFENQKCNYSEIALFVFSIHKKKYRRKSPSKTLPGF